MKSVYSKFNTIVNIFVFLFVGASILAMFMFVNNGKDIQTVDAAEPVAFDGALAVDYESECASKLTEYEQLLEDCSRIKVDCEATVETIRKECLEAN
jgi:hypothetical protein